MEKCKRPLAILALILIGLLLLGAIVLALIGTAEATRLLMLDLFLLVCVPAVFFVYQHLLNLLKDRKEKEE